jgi:hypothetical protein
LEAYPLAFAAVIIGAGPFPVKKERGLDLVLDRPSLDMILIKEILVFQRNRG